MIHAKIFDRLDDGCITFVVVGGCVVTFERIVIGSNSRACGGSAGLGFNTNKELLKVDKAGNLQGNG